GGTITGEGTITGGGRIAADGTAEKEKSASSGFRLKGILALCIFLSGLCGLLTDWEDRKEKRFMRVAPDWMTTIVNIWVPTLYTSLIALFCLILTRQLPIPFLGMNGESGTLTGLGGFGTTAGVMLCIGKELCHLVFYQFLIVVYCSIIRLLVRRQELIAAAIPILTLASMICSPVWIRLSLYLPAFRILEKFFPATYYLLL
ncbi:MAG: hypothetical protein K2P65_07270, partial [Lachnospiraceae bacterium]|nr:hypothetical protein [Lachnospiraceae bacterium]